MSLNKETTNQPINPNYLTINKGIHAFYKFISGK